MNEEDILLKQELDDLAAKHDNFNVYYVLNNPPAGWTGGVGFVTADMIREHCPAPAKDVKILLCGPPPMIKAMTTVCIIRYVLLDIRLMGTFLHYRQRLNWVTTSHVL